MAIPKLFYWNVVVASVISWSHPHFAIAKKLHMRLLVCIGAESQQLPLNLMRSIIKHVHPFTMTNAAIPPFVANSVFCSRVLNNILTECSHVETSQGPLSHCLCTTKYF